MKVKNLVKSYRARKIIDNLSFEKNYGIVLIKGPSGSGKSTLISLLRGEIKPDSGQIEKSSDEIDFSYSGQTPSLLDFKSLKENFLLFKKEDIDSKTLKKAEELNFLSLIDKPLINLSSGERQKAEFLFALSSPCKVIYLDEPYSSMDKESKKIAIKFINEESSQHLIFLVSHNDELDDDLNVEMQISFNEETIAVKAVQDNEDINAAATLKPNKASFFSIFILDFKKKALTFSIIQAFLTLCIFLTILLGISFSNSNSYENMLKIGLANDPFTSHQVLINSSSAVTNFFDFNQYQSVLLSENSDSSKIAIYENLSSDDKTVYYFHNQENALKFQNGDKIDIKDDEFTITIIDKNSLKQYLPNTFLFSSIIDGYDLNTSVFISSSKFLNLLISSNANDILCSNDKVSLDFNFSLFNFNNQNITGANRINFEISHQSPNLFQVSSFPQNTMFFLNKNQILKTNGDGVNNATVIGINVYRYLFSKVNSYSLENGLEPIMTNDEIIANASKAEIIVVDAFIEDMQLPYNFLCFVVAAVLLIIDIIFIFFSRKDNKYFRYEIDSLAVNHGYQTKINTHYLFTTFLCLFLLIFAISIIIYSFCFIPVSNYVYMVTRYGRYKNPDYYYYSQQPLNPFYDFLNKPISWITFSPWSLIVIPLSVLLSFIAMKSFQKQHN